MIRKKIIYFIFIILSFSPFFVYANNVENGWHLVKTLTTSDIKESCSLTGESCSYYRENNPFYTNDRIYDWAYYNNDIEEKRVNRMLCAHEGTTGSSSNHLYPYNSTLSYYMTKELGFNCNEIDVRFTSDNIPVVSHNSYFYIKDNYIYQIAKDKDGETIPESSKIYISNITYDELKNYKIVSRYSNIIDEEQIDEDCETYLADEYENDNNYCKRITTLNEIVDLSRKNKMALSIEIKAGNEESIKNMVELVNDSFNQESIRWMSTNDDYLNYVIEVNDHAIIERIDSSTPLSEQEKEELYNDYKEKCNDCYVNMPSKTNNFNENYNDKYVVGFSSQDIGFNYPEKCSCCLDAESLNIDFSLFNIKKDKYLLYDHGITIKQISDEVKIETLEFNDDDVVLPIDEENPIIIKTGYDTSFGAYNYHIAIKGDVTKDGLVTISDVSKIYRSTKGTITLSELEEVAGDYNENGTINITDVSGIYRMTR